MNLTLSREHKWLMDLKSQWSPPLSKDNEHFSLLWTTAVNLTRKWLLNNTKDSKITAYLSIITKLKIKIFQVLKVVAVTFNKLSNMITFKWAPLSPSSKAEITIKPWAKATSKMGQTPLTWCSRCKMKSWPTKYKITV